MTSYKNVFLFFMFAWFSAFQLTAQKLMPYPVVVQMHGDALPMPWVGGFNSPQFSNIDLNGDGVQDLFVFDRVGGAVETFVRSDNAWVYAPQYIQAFPEMRNYALLRDFDGDGVVDIFTNSFDIIAAGIKLFKGSRNGDNWTFTPIIFHSSNAPFNQVIPYTLPNSSTNSRVYCINDDLPAIDDVDGDGDLDIISFELFGSQVNFYENKAADKGKSDTLIYELTDICWGGFIESGLSSDIILSDTPGECAESGGLHAGSTMTTLDINGDGLSDVLIGDLSNDNLSLLTNAGTVDEAWMNQIDVSFPSYDKPAEMNIFLSSAYVDTDGNGKRELIVAPNAASSGRDKHQIWRYNNIGTDASPTFKFQETDFLVGDCIDLGTGAQPTFADVNADGLLDIIVGNAGEVISVDTNYSSLYYFQNVGTDTEPAFRLVDDNWLSLRHLSVTSSPSSEFAPTFGDLDSDGDQDLLVGERSGKLYFFENIGGAGNPMVFDENNYDFPYMDIDIDNHVIPQLADLDRDGLLDIILGSRLGYFQYFKNQGTATVPFFASDLYQAPNQFKMGNVQTTEYHPVLGGYSAPVFLDFGDHWTLFSGSIHGNIYRYGEIDNRLSDTFQLLTSEVGGIRKGGRTRLAIADINQDGRFEFLIGNLRGGLSLYTSNLKTDGSVRVANTVRAELDLRVFPNPSQGQNLQVSVLHAMRATLEWKLSDMHGRILMSGTSAESQFSLSTQHLSTGMYILSVQHPDGIGVRRIVIQ